jgi:hypothetical protein
MRSLVVALIVVAATAQSFAAPPKPAAIRTVRNLPNFPLEALRVGVSRPLYRSLLVSPVSVYLMARTSLVNGRAVNARIVHHDADGAYDSMILAIANSYEGLWQNTTESRVQSDTLNVYLLMYDIKDGKMAVCFSHSDDPRYAEYRQRSLAWVGVSQGGEWKTISGQPQKKWGRRP